MSKRIAALSAVAALVAFSSAWAQNASPGSVNVQLIEAPPLDPYTDAPTAADEQWFENNIYRMGVYSPYFDTRTAWYPNGLVYQDMYAMYPGTALVAEHPDWIMHDQNGNQLYLDWGCSNGSCPEFAGDIANPAFRANWIATMQQNLNDGNYKGLWIDDVNMNFLVCNSSGNFVAPIDDATGLPMTYTAWRAYVAQFMTQVRAAFPTQEITENSIWFAGPPGVLDADPYIQQQLRTATNINMERGVTNDPNLTGGTGEFSIYSFLAYIDRVHALGLNVTMGEYQVTTAQAQYGLASYFLISNGNDRIGDQSTTPANWWSGYTTQLGAPLGARTYTNGVFQRNFNNGMVLLGEPGLASQTITLPGTLETLEGQYVTSVTLTGSQGIVLTGPVGLYMTPPPPAVVTPVTPPPATPVVPYSILRQASSLTPTYAWQSWGTLQDNLTVSGNPIRLNGVQYAQGLGTHAYSEIHYALYGNCTTFTATVGVDDEVPPGVGSLMFQVWGDGNWLAQSPTMTSGSPAAKISANLSGYQTLSLVVTSGIYMAPFWDEPDDHADWANAIIGCIH